MGSFHDRRGHRLAVNGAHFGKDCEESTSFKIRILGSEKFGVILLFPHSFNHSVASQTSESSRAV